MKNCKKFTFLFVNSNFHRVLYKNMKKEFQNQTLNAIVGMQAWAVETYFYINFLTLCQFNSS